MRQAAENTIKDPKKSMGMATQTTVTVTEECLTEERVQEVLQVHPQRKPFSKEMIGLRFALTQEKKGIEKYRWPLLWIVTSTPNIDQPRSILTDRAISMHDCGTKGTRHLHLRKTQSRRKQAADPNNLSKA